MIQELIHKKICESRGDVDAWFKEKSSGLAFPFYSSFDIRDSAYKVVPVDANIFPAGFNNICQTDKDSGPELVKDYLQDHYPNVKENILLLTEEHTKNAYYWENVHTLKKLIEQAGFRVQVGVPKDLPEPLSVQSSGGHQLLVHSAKRVDNGVKLDGESVELIICNNDFSEEHAAWSSGLQTPMNPPHELGWYRRKKSDFFASYNLLASELAEVLKLDPWCLRVQTELFSEFDIGSEESREQLAQRVEAFLENQKEKFLAHKIDSEPFVFIKNNSGTYGLGVIQARSGEEVRSWSYKSRKKMKASKGGGGVREVVIQEGIPSSLRSESGETAEPAIYMLGCSLIGGFLRVHGKKGPEESLNSPGAIYKKLCVSDLNVDVAGAPMENVYGWVSKLGALAIAQEAKASGVSFHCYQ